MIYFSEIPLNNTPVRFGISLQDVRYQLTIRYRSTGIAGGCGWTIDIADTYGAPLVSGIPMVTGADLLAQYEYLNFGGGLMVATDGDDKGAHVPTFGNLGTSSHLYWVTWT